MNVGIVNVRLRLFGVSSLKEKRSITKRLVNDIKNKYNVSIVEIGNRNSRYWAEIGIALVARNKVHIEKVIDSITDYIERTLGVEVEFLRKEVW